MKIFFFFFSILTACCLATPFPVTENGRPVADIVLADHTDVTLRHAADELQLWMKEITGAELPVLQTPGELPQHIWLGTTAVVQQSYAKDFLTLDKTDGYAVRRDGNNLYLYGAMSKGVLNGVYRLLQRNTDIIWVRPDTEIGTIFTVTPTLSLKENDYMDVPLMLLRGWKVDYPVPTKEVMWNIRNCANWCSIPKEPDMLAARNGWGLWQEMFYGHNVITRYLSPTKYWKDHPNIFAAHGGVRKQPTWVNGRMTTTQPCFSNPETLDIFLKEMDAKVRSLPNEKWFSVCIEDNEVCCDCERCKEPIKLPDGRVLQLGDPAFYSTRYYMFLNEVARFLKKNHPGCGVSTYAYLFTEIAPAVPIEDNIRIICTAPFKDIKYPVYAPQNEYSFVRLKSWLDYGRPAGIVLYDYHGLSNDYPRPSDVNTANDYRWSYERGIRSAYSEVVQDTAEKIYGHNNHNTCSSIWDSNGIYIWVINQLLWNPYQDINTLRRMYLDRVYGAAADDVAEYLSYAEMAWNRSPFPALYHTNPNISWSALVQCGFVEKCHEALAWARSRNLSPKSRQYLERLIAPFENNNLMKVYPEVMEFSHKQRANPKAYPNIVMNPSFEEHGNQSGVAQTDTTTLGANHWNFWRRNFGTCGMSETDAEDGKNCAWFADTDNACILQDIVLQPGLYLVRAKVKIERYPESVATISARFRMPNGTGWDDHVSSKFFSPNLKQGEWCEIEGYFFSPSDERRLSFQLGCAKSVGKVFFDHVELYKIK